MDHIYVIRRPLVTEKSTAKMEEKQYSFEVDIRADKNLIKAAVESLYKVRVLSVRTQIRRNPNRRMKYGIVSGKEWKTALVRLHADDVIDILS